MATPASDLLWELLLEHLSLDHEKLDKQKAKIRSMIADGYGKDIQKGMSLEALLALNEKIENEVYGKKNFLEEIREEGGAYKVKMLSYRCPLQKQAAKNPKVCAIHRMHYRVLGELCGWDISPKSIDLRKDDCSCVLTAKRLKA